MNESNRLRAERLQRAGGGVLRWSLIILLVFFGALKWTAAEAQGVAPFIDNSPFLAWLGRALGQQGASEVIGVIELTTAVLLGLRGWSSRAALVGGGFGVVMFLTTLSFLVTTPALGEGAAFLLKDMTLLGAAIWMTGEAWVALESTRAA